MLKQIFAKALPLFLGLFCLGLFVFVSKPALAANPTTLNFQGKVVNSNGTNVTNGTYSFIFRLYDSSTATNISTNCSDNSHCWWEETQSSVSVTNGVFQVELGSVCAFSSACNSTHSGINWSSNNALYLTMQFNGDSSGSYFGFMTPLIHLTSVPYAFQADNSSNLGGIAAANFVQLATGNLQADGSTNNSIAVNKTGASGNILLLESNGKTALTVNNAGGVVLGQAGASGLAGSLTFDNASDASTASISFTGNSTASYTYLLPTASVGSGLCLESGTVSSGNVPLLFNSCTAGTYTTIQNSGSSLTQRSTLNFTGNGVSCVDNSGSSRTDCAVAPTLQNAYDNSASPASIVTSSVAKNVVIQSGAGLNSTGAFQIQNANGYSVINTSTVSFSQNLIANPSFESNTVGWAKFTTAGTETTFTTSSTNPQFGTQSLNVVTTSAAGAGSDSTVGQGAKYTYAFNPDTTYTFSVYASVSGTTTNNFEIGAHVNAADLTPCTGLSLGTSIARYSCTFTTGATTTGSDYLFVRRSDATVITMYIDGAQLEAAGSASSFSDQPYPNLVSDPDIELGSGSWTQKGSATASVSTDYTKFGYQSLKTVTTASTNDGGQYSLPLFASSRYTMNLWAKADSNITAILGRQENGSNVETGCSGFTITTSWQQFSCTFTVGATVNSATNIYLRQTTAAIHSIYIDGATLVANGIGMSYQSPGISLDTQPLYSNLTLNSNNSGEIQPWQLSNNVMPAARQCGTSLMANGYVYYLGGDSSSTCNGTNAQKTVYYAKLNTDGSIGSWQTNQYTIPTAVERHESVYYNGYIYVLGGETGSSTYSTSVYYAKLNTDGSTQPWQVSPYTLNAAGGRVDTTAIVAYGYVFIISGVLGNAPGADSSIYYAKLNGDGSTGPWSANATTTPIALQNASISYSNGYVYAVGGFSGSSAQTSVYFTKLSAGGVISSWTQTTSLPIKNSGANAVISSGYIYNLGGISSGTSINSVIYAKLHPDGTIGKWITSSNPLPQNRSAAGVTVNNGYIYEIGGLGSAASSSVFYTSTSRALIGSNLDLVGLSGQDLAGSSDGSLGSSGGSLTAGNTSVVGTLQVAGQSSFNNSVAVGGTLSVGGGAFIKGASGGSATNNIFQVQNSGGINLFTSSTVNLISNSSFEGGVTNLDNAVDGWSKKLGTETSIKNQTTAPLFGSQSLELITTTATGQGVIYKYANLQPSTQYTLSFYAEVSTGNFSTLTFGRSDTGASGGETSCVTTGAISNTYNRFSCTFTTGSTIGASGTPYIYITKGTDASVRTIYIDGVQLELGATATDYRNGDLTVDSLASFKSTANSTNAFQVQNSSGTAILSVNSATAGISVSGNISQTSGTVSLTANGASSFTTSSGALTLDANGGINLGNATTSTILIGDTSAGSTQVQSANGLVVGTASITGAIGLYGGSNQVTIKAGASTEAYNLVLPASSGTNNYCLANTSTPGTLQWLPCGAGSTATVTLAPEFVGAVMTGVGGSNTGTMTSDYCAGTSRFPSGVNTSICTNATDEHNYYTWTSTGANNYDIFFRWSVPNDFASFPSSNSSFYGWKTGTAAGDDVKLNVYNNSSTACASQSMTNTSGSWQTTSINMSGCAPSPGTALTIDVHLSVSTSGNFARIGEITLQYNRD